MASFGKFNLCCNPLQYQNHTVKNGLRRVSVTHQRLNNLSNTHYLCTSCRKLLDLRNKHENGSENVNTENTNSVISNNSYAILNEDLTQQTSGLTEISVTATLSVVNQAFGLLNESPIPKKRLRSQTYLQNKISKVYLNLNKSVGIVDENDDEVTLNQFLEMINKLKNKFHDINTNRCEKIQILTLLPETWILNRICHTMKGILSTPNPKIGRLLSNDIKLKVLEFYLDDEVSVNMPGMKDYLSIRNDNGKREHIQKRLILCNLKELYKLFEMRYPDYRLGFSKFASFRPQHCVLAGSSGTHTTCVCAMHQNVKLMILGCNLVAFTKNLAKPLQLYSDCLEMITCQNPTKRCYFLNCDKCPGIDTLKDCLLNVFNENNVDEITYKIWISKPRTSLESFVKYSSDFVDDFCENIIHLLPHNYIAKEQAKYLRTLKESLEENEYIVICDFAENYVFVIQSAASGFHWNNNQSTIYPVVIYYKQYNELVHKSMVIISDCLSHDAVAVYEFTRITISFIKKLSNDAVKIFYFSDGAIQQFKNYMNLYYHKEDFGLNAEWHYFATAHGKGPCDGIGGSLKRIAARTSLHLPFDKQISTSQQLYDWAVKPNSLPNIHVDFLSNERYIQAKELLQIRYKRAKTITGTQKYHCVIPNRNGTLKFKEFSLSSEFQIHNLLKHVKN
ncbi:uncharacterized protein [Prorops nasuta]|uniref:uncharacterized protein n=1 Tax=Prorops nasuta TaxID=863751 RepID=UPI0034CD700F